MKNYRIIFISFIILLQFGGSLLFGQNIVFNTRFFNKTIYYPDSDIELFMEIVNDSPAEYRFKLADYRLFNLDIEVRTLDNKILEHSENYVIQKNSGDFLFYKEVTIAPGERFSFTVMLFDFAVKPMPGLYVINTKFYPQLSVKKSEFLQSSPLSLSVKNKLQTAEMTDKIDDQTGMIIQKQPLAPDETVKYMLTARQKNQWEKFFLYLDLESLLLSNPGMSASYKKAGEAEQLKMISEFRESLKDGLSDVSFLQLPYVFQVEKTSYTSERGTVTVTEKFKYPDFTEIRSYTYYLKKLEGIWYIYSYTVTNKGTE